MTGPQVLAEGKYEPPRPNSLKLSPRKEKAALLLADGVIQAEAARRCGVTPKTMSMWARSPAVIARVEQLRTDITKQALELLEQETLDAVKVVIEIAKHGGTPGVVSSQLKAALWIAERRIKGPPTGAASRQSESNSTADRLSDEEAEELLARGQ
jgi:hypothetical protein